MASPSRSSSVASHTSDAFLAVSLSSLTTFVFLFPCRRPRVPYDYDAYGGGRATSNRHYEGFGLRPLRDYGKVSPLRFFGLRSGKRRRCCIRLQAFPDGYLERLHNDLRAAEFLLSPELGFRAGNKRRRDFINSSGNILRLRLNSEGGACGTHAFQSAAAGQAGFSRKNYSDLESP